MKLLKLTAAFGTLIANWRLNKPAYPCESANPKYAAIPLAKGLIKGFAVFLAVGMRILSRHGESQRRFLSIKLRLMNKVFVRINEHRHNLGYIENGWIAERERHLNTCHNLTNCADVI